MSVSIVSNQHISAILGAYSKTSKEWFSDYDAKIKGQMLLDANCKSVNSRYGENNNLIFKLDIELFETFYDMVQAMKFCDSLEYQSCAFPEWHISKSFSLLQTMRHAISCCVPGYANAKLSI